MAGTRRVAARVSRNDQAHRRDLQSGLHLLLLPPQTGTPWQQQQIPHFRRNPGNPYTAVHRGAGSQRSGFFLAGGEPTLLGLEFFEKGCALEQKYKKPHQRIENDLQTNGTLLDDEWCAFLKKHSFLVGLSIDGPKELHDRYRVAKMGNRRSIRCSRRRRCCIGMECRSTHCAW